ncbi:MAG: hypothetical protein LBL41_03880 [Bifidobacteriaceae bacterium]|jgi:hypothetical protein|nr:hypothetical protein [Bifidobacteriaceae bacterium]
MTTKEFSIIDQRLQVIETMLERVLGIEYVDVSDEERAEFADIIAEYERDPSTGTPLDQALAEAGVSI